MDKPILELDVEFIDSPNDETQETSQDLESKGELIDIEEELEDVSDESEDMDLDIESDITDEDDNTALDKEIEISEDDSDEDDDYSEEVYLEFANHLKEDLFPDATDEELKSVNSMDQIRDLTKKAFTNELYAWKEDYQKSLIENLISTGKIKKEQVEDYNFSTVSSKKELIDNIAAQEQVLLEDYISKGFSEKKAKRLVENELELEDAALEAFESLEKGRLQANKQIAQDVEKSKQDAMDKQESFMSTMKDNTFQYNEFVPGKKVNDKTKAKVFDNIQPVLAKINGDLAKYAPILAYLDHYEMLDVKFKVPMDEAKSKSVKAMGELLSAKKKTRGRSSSNSDNMNLATSKNRIYK